VGTESKVNFTQGKQRATEQKVAQNKKWKTWKSALDFAEKSVLKSRGKQENRNRNISLCIKLDTK